MMSTLLFTKVQSDYFNFYLSWIYGKMLLWNQEFDSCLLFELCDKGSNRNK